MRPAQPAARALALALLLAAVGVPAAAQPLSGFRVVSLDAERRLYAQVAGADPYRTETVEGLPRFALLPSGRTRIVLLEASSSDEDAARDRIATVEVDLTEGTYHTLLVGFPAPDAAAPVQGGPNVETVLVGDDLALPGAGEASLRIVHAALLEEGLEIEVRDSLTPDRGEEDAPHAFSVEALERLAVSASRTLPAGRYAVVVRRPGEERGPLDVDLRAGVAYSLVVTGLSPDAVGARLIVDAAVPAPPHVARPAEPPPDTRAEAEADVAALRFVHLASDAPTVDVLVGGRPVLRDVSFLTRSEVVVVGAGRHELRVFPHRAPRGRAVTEDDGQAAPRAVPLEPVVSVVELPPGSVTTVALTGAYEPPIEEERRGHLSLQVDPEDAELVVEGPRGYRSVHRGSQFLVGLEPGPYGVAVSRSGFEGAEYEAEVTADATAIVTITLQEAGEEADDGAPVERSERQATWRGLELQPYRDAPPPLAPAGRALVRIVHAAPTLTSFDVVVRPEGEEPHPEDVMPPLTIGGLAYPNASSFHPLGPYAYLLELRVAGTSTPLHRIDGLQFHPGATYTLFVSADPLTNEVWVTNLVDALVPHLVPAGGTDP